MGDTLLWCIAAGYDVPHMIADVVSKVGDEPKQIAGYWNMLRNWPGVYGTLSFTPQQHNGYPDNQVVMCQANSFRDSVFKMAPGYGT